MSHKQYFISDTHFGHENIIKFVDNKGNKLRDFKSIEEHDNLIIENINKRVRIQDKLYLLGDVVMNRRCLSILERINTKKRVLIKGNHDIFTLKDYSKYFRDIRAYKVMPKYGIIFSHIPIHPNNLMARFKLNVHGHLHEKNYDDEKYMNICVEQTNYEPVELQEILTRRSND